MYIHIGYRRQVEHTGWSAGYCPACKQHGAVRLEKEVRQWFIWFVPVHSQVRERVACCDFCDESLGPEILSMELPHGRWSREEGLPALMRRLLPDTDIQASSVDWNARMHALLARAKAASKLKLRGDMGGAIGMIVGISIGSVLANVAVENRFGDVDPENTLSAAILLILGGVCGLAIGSLLQALWERNAVIRRVFSEAMLRYPFELSGLDDLASGYGPRVARIVRKLCDEEGPRPKPGRWED